MNIFKKTVLIFTILFAVAACNQDKPEKTVDNFYNAIEKNDLAATKKYLDVAIFDTIDTSELELMKPYFEKIKHKTPVLVEKDGDAAKVSVEVTAVDLMQVIQAFMKDVVEKAMQDNTTVDKLDNKELDTMLLEAISSPNAPVVTKVLTFNMIKGEGKKWVIVTNEAFRAGLYMQDPNEDKGENNHENNEDSYFLTGEETALATVKELKDEIGMCAFVIDNVNYFMYCNDSHVEQLKGKEGQTVTISYQILSKKDESEKIYVLKEVK